jgi:5'-nucleotidase
MKILLANDDGIQAVGLRALYFALVEAGHDVRVVAPVTEQSAVGHAVTLSMPLRVKDFKEDGFRGQGVYGTPVDCVKLALSTLLETPPDLVLSGINAGANVGVDILYSGTVSAATEGALMELPDGSGGRAGPVSAHSGLVSRLVRRQGRPARQTLLLAQRRHSPGAHQS